MTPKTPVTVRCTVEGFNYSACGLEVGDSFEIGERGLVVPEGKRFCYFAIANVVALLGSGMNVTSRPLVACPDPPENLHMRLERVNEEDR
ncbi:TIGR04076 family protein [Kineococcus sp. SYSU DK018]|uniref:TIGR04076 family protein n=1 Tax=Kineococcus sp. SYSU DK018 TaxID=3383139 RepID=UPI003D7DA95B